MKWFWIKEVLIPWPDPSKPRAVNLPPTVKALSAIAVIMAFSTPCPPLVNVTAPRPAGASGRKFFLIKSKNSLPTTSLVVKLELTIAESNSFP